MHTAFTSERVSNLNESHPTGIQFMAENQDSGIAQPIIPNEKNSQWSNIPSLPLEKIYSFLRREDQANMSLVCRKWSEGFGLPSLWKTFVFYLTEPQLSMGICPLMKFAQKYSSMFRHVKVCYKFTRRKPLIKSWRRYFIAFLQILTYNSQLISIELRRLSHTLLHIDDPTYDDVCRAVSNFFESQHHLQRVEFHDCYFAFRNGVEFHKKITENSKDSLRHIVHRNFVDSKGLEQNSNFVHTLPYLTNFPNLTALEIDYTLLFENMVARLSTASAKLKNFQLSRITLIYDSKMIKLEELRGLTSAHWQFLKSLCPNLKLEVIISTDTPSRWEMEFTIVPYMPIVRLEYRYETFDLEMQTDELFGHLLSYNINANLVSLRLEWWCVVWDFASPFAQFLPACKKLKKLELIIIYPTNYIDLMKYWLANPPEFLEKVLIFITEIEDEENYTILNNLTSEYVSRLKLIGLNIEVGIEGFRGV